MMRLALITALAVLSPAAAHEDDVAAVQVAVNLNQLKVGEKYRQELHNFQDIEYSGTLQIGSQKLRGIYDTGSFELLVISKRCKSPSCKNNKHYYDPSASKSFSSGEWSKVHKFGSGQCKSHLSTDELQVGAAEGSTGVASKHQSFWEVTEAEMDILLDGSFGAIVGLGDPKEPLDDLQKFVDEDESIATQYTDTSAPVPAWLSSQTGNDREFLHMMEHHPTLLENLGVTKFSVCFLRQPHSAGYFVWHDEDPNMLPMFQKVPITGKNTWSAPMSDVTLGDSAGGWTACTKDRACTGLLDTGTSLIAAPTHAITELQTKLRQIGGGDCSNIHRMPNLEFNFNGAKVSLPPQAYVGQGYGEVPAHLRQYFSHMEASNGTKSNGCDLLLMALDIKQDDGSELWIMGMPFFREYFTTFDLGSDDKFSNRVTKRSVHVSPADDGCNHPTTRRQAFKSDTSRVVRQINMAKVRVPPVMARRNFKKERMMMKIA